MKKAFISYSHHDWDRAARVSEALKAIGWSPFLDKERLSPGSAWRATLKTELGLADLLIIVLTKEWLTSDFTIAELETYVKAGRRASKERVLIIPLEFDGAIEKDYLIPQLNGVHIVKGAEELNHDQLRWLLFCGINSCPPGPPGDWEESGSKVKDTNGAIGAPQAKKSRPLNPAERLRLEQDLDHIKSPQRIREIAWETLGREVELPEDPKIAWYKLIKMVSELGLSERLCEAADVDYERLFGPSGSSEESKG